MRTRSGLIAAALILTVVGGTAWAARGILLHYFAFPGYEVGWQKNIGVPDGSKFQQGLLLEKADTSSAPETHGSGVAFSGAGGTTLTELGYLIKDGSICGVFPRYRVRTPNGDPRSTADDYNYLFECQLGTHTPSPYAGWTTVSFEASDAVPDTTLGAQAHPTFAFGTEISSLGLLFHLDGMVGSATLDNLNVSGQIFGKPGR